MTDRQEWNRAVVAEFRANAGVVGGDFAGVPLLLLTSTGARSGEPRLTPLTYLRDGEDLVVFGANGGRPVDPGWYHNVRADPRVTVEVGTRTYPATAEVSAGAQRQRLWEVCLAGYPPLARFAAATEREIPVVLLRQAEPGREGER